MKAKKGINRISLVSEFQPEMRAPLNWLNPGKLPNRKTSLSRIYWAHPYTTEDGPDSWKSTRQSTPSSPGNSLEQRVRAWREQSSAEMKTEPILLVGQDYANQADALLYLGPAASLTESPIIPDICLDEEFRTEINRRNVILTGRPLSDRILQVSPVPFH